MSGGKAPASPKIASLQAKLFGGDKASRLGGLTAEARRGSDSSLVGSTSPKNKGYARAVYDFHANDESKNQLAFDRSDVFTIIDDTNYGDWYWVQKGNAAGLVAKNYVEPMTSGSNGDSGGGSRGGGGKVVLGGGGKNKIAELLEARGMNARGRRTDVLSRSLPSSASAIATSASATPPASEPVVSSSTNGGDRLSASLRSRPRPAASRRPKARHVRNRKTDHPGSDGEVEAVPASPSGSASKAREKEAVGSPEATTDGSGGSGVIGTWVLVLILLLLVGGGLGAWMALKGSVGTGDVVLND